MRSAVTSRYKGSALQRLGQASAALAAWDQTEDSFGTSPIWALKQQVAMALFNKAVLLDATGQRAQAAAIFRSIPERFGGAAELSLSVVPGALSAAVIGEDAKQRASAKSAPELEAYETNDLDARQICFRNAEKVSHKLSEAGLDLSCMEAAAQHNPADEKTQFFLGVAYIYAKDKERTLAQVVRLRKMGGGDSGMLLSLVSEGWPEWLKDPRFQAEAKRANAEEGAQRPPGGP